MVAKLGWHSLSVTCFDAYAHPNPRHLTSLACVAECDRHTSCPHPNRVSTASHIANARPDYTCSLRGALHTPIHCHDTDAAHVKTNVGRVCGGLWEGSGRVVLRVFGGCVELRGCNLMYGRQRAQIHNSKMLTRRLFRNANAARRAFGGL